MDIALSITLLLGLVAGYVAVVAAALWLTSLITQRHDRGLAAARSEAYEVCGNCGYRVQGWAGPACPECGVDPRDVRPKVVPATTWRAEVLMALPGAAAVLLIVVAMVVVVWLL